MGYRTPLEARGRTQIHADALSRSVLGAGEWGLFVYGVLNRALIITGLPAEQVVVLLNENAIPFAEVSAHRASLEDAYLRLTQDAVEFRAGGEAAR